MGRAEIRRNKRAEIALETKVNKLNDRDTMLIELLAIKKFNEYTGQLDKILDNCYKKAMRDTRVSEKRAEKIIEKANRLMKIESEGMGK